MIHLFRKSARILFLFCFVSLLIVSCHDKDPVQPKTSSKAKNDIYSLNGILAFSSTKKYVEFIQENKLQGTNQLKDFENKHNYESFLTFSMKWDKLNDIDKQNYSKETDLVSLSNNQLSMKSQLIGVHSLINKDGFIIIGPKLYRFTAEKVMSIYLSKEINLNVAISALKGKNTYKNKVEIHNIDYQIKGNNGGRVGVGSWKNTSSPELVSVPGGVGSPILRFYYSNLNLALSSYPVGAYECSGGYYYDSDCTCYECNGSLTYYEYHVQALIWSIDARYNQDYIWNSFSNAYDDALYLRVTGNFTVYANNTPIPLSINNTKQNFYQNSGTVWEAISGTNQPVYNNLQVEGTINGEVNHSVNKKTYTTISL